MAPTLLRCITITPSKYAHRARPYAQRHAYKLKFPGREGPLPCPHTQKKTQSFHFGSRAEILATLFTMSSRFCRPYFGQDLTDNAASECQHTDDEDEAGDDRHRVAERIKPIYTREAC